MVSNDIVVNRNPPKGSAWSREEMILVLNLYFKLPYAFTEQGLAMLSGILNSDVAQPRKDFEELKLDIEDILHDQNDINEETRAQLDAISDALAELQGQKARRHNLRPLQALEDWDLIHENDRELFRD